MSSIVSNGNDHRIFLNRSNSTGEMAKQWPIRTHRSDSTNTTLPTPKSTIHSHIRDGNKSSPSNCCQVNYRRISQGLIPSG